MQAERVSKVHKLYKAEQERLDHFDRILIEGCKSEWWRLFVGQIKDRMDDLLMMLVSSPGDPNNENKLRGQILECSFILTLDERAKGLDKENENASQR